MSRQAKSKGLRIYSHTDDLGRYTLCIINLQMSSDAVNLSFQAPVKQSHDEYHLTSAGGLSATSALLNGQILEVEADGAIPELKPKKNSKMTVDVAPHSIAFVVF